METRITVVDGQATYYVHVDFQPTALFTLSPTSGTAPLAVQFTDTSLNSPTTWQWTFSDGTGSTEQNPLHVYTTPGYYALSLLVTNSAGWSLAGGYLIVS